MTGAEPEAIQSPAGDLMDQWHSLRIGGIHRKTRASLTPSLIKFNP